MDDAGACRILICERDAKWSESVRARLREAGTASYERPVRRRMRTRTRSDVSVRFERNASTAWFPSVSVIFGEPSPSLLLIVMASGIIKGWGMSSLTACLALRASDASVGNHVSVGCLIIAPARPESRSASAET